MDGYIRGSSRRFPLFFSSPNSHSHFNHSYHQNTTYHTRSRTTTTQTTKCSSLSLSPSSLWRRSPLLPPPPLPHPPLSSLPSDHPVLVPGTSRMETQDTAVGGSRECCCVVVFSTPSLQHVPARSHHHSPHRPHAIILRRYTALARDHTDTPVTGTTSSPSPLRPTLADLTAVNG